MASTTRPAQPVDVEEVPGVPARVASSSTPSDRANLGSDIHEPHWRQSRMVEISSSGSDEGLERVTLRPTLPSETPSNIPQAAAREPCSASIPPHFLWLPGRRPRP
jgi:hypothetical protein